MIAAKRFAIATAFLLAAAMPASASGQLPDSDIASLQAAMQSHIDQMSVDGALLNLDAQTGEVHKFYPAKAHPMIMKVGSYYYLCADFRDADGKDKMVNFYAAKDGDRFVIFYTDFTADEDLEHKIEQKSEVAAN